MNKAQAVKRADALKAKLEEIRDEFDMLKSEMEDYHGDKSERWQESETGEAYQAMIDAMQDAYDAIDNACGDIESAIEG